MAPGTDVHPGSVTCIARVIGVPSRSSAMLRAFIVSEQMKVGAFDGVPRKPATFGAGEIRDRRDATRQVRDKHTRVVADSGAPCGNHRSVPRKGGAGNKADTCGAKADQHVAAGRDRFDDVVHWGVPFPNPSLNWAPWLSMRPWHNLGDAPQMSQCADAEEFSVARADDDPSTSDREEIVTRAGRT